MIQIITMLQFSKVELNTFFQQHLSGGPQILLVSQSSPSQGSTGSHLPQMFAGAIRLECEDIMITPYFPFHFYFSVGGPSYIIVCFNY